MWLEQTGRATPKLPLPAVLIYQVLQPNRGAVNGKISQIVGNEAGPSIGSTFGAGRLRTSRDFDLFEHRAAWLLLKSEHI